MNCQQVNLCDFVVKYWKYFDEVLLIKYFFVYKMKSFYFLSIAFIFLIKSVKCDDEYSMADDSNGTERILSRRRRYLTFPEGSSVQLGEFQSF